MFFLIQRVQHSATYEMDKVTASNTFYIFFNLIYGQSPVFFMCVCVCFFLLLFFAFVVVVFCLFVLAYLSRRLIGELIVYPWPGFSPPVVGVIVLPFTISNIFSSETAWPIEVKFYVEPPWVGGTKVYSRHPGHMTKMAATPIYGKNPSKIFYSGTGRPISTKLGM